MKRTMVMVSVLGLVAVGLWACGQVSDGETQAGAGEGMLELLPKTAQGVLFMDVRRAMATPLVQNALQKKDGDLEEFTKRTGIDPSKDIYFLAAAISGQPKGDDSKGAMVLQLEYDREKLLAKLREEEGDVAVESYEGVDIVSLHDDSGDGPTHAALLDGEHLAFGTPEVVRGVVDVKQKRAENALRNTKLMESLAAIDREAIFWGGYVVSEETAQRLAQGNPMMSNLGGVRSVVLSIDYQELNVLGEVVAKGENEEQNQQIAEFLNGIKAFVAMGSQEKPEVGEMLRKIQVTPAVDHVRVTASIPEDLLLRVQKAD